MSSAKAIMAFAAAFLTALLAEWIGGEDAFQVRDLLVALAAALASGALVFAIPNRSSNRGL